MSKKIKLYDTGDLVEVTVWQDVLVQRVFKENTSKIGLVLEAELIEMPMAANEYEKEYEKSEYEWMYRVLLPDGEVSEIWDYEIKPVNVMGKEYNTLSQQALEKKNGREHTKRT